jgi:glycosyltransferase involved in cell wall biosynthesis
VAELAVDLVLAGSTGGIGTHVGSLSAGLVSRGVRVRVLGPAATQELFDFRGGGADFEPVELSAGLSARDLAAARGLRRLLTADVVHAHGLRAGLVCGLALGPRRPDRRPLVTTWHNALIDRGPKAALWRWAARSAARRADVTLGASADLVESAREYGAQDARLGEVAAPALAPPQRDPRAVRAELGCVGRPLVVAVGRLHPQKGFDTLVRAAADWMVADGAADGAEPAPLVVIAGDGPERARLAELIAALRAPVRLLGRCDDVADLLRAADVAVISSIWEARALVAQEALLAGTPLVATAVGGIPGLVGEGAVLVPPGDAVQLGRALRSVLEDPALATRLREAGRARAASWPDEAAVVASVEAVYRQLVGRAR